jgi:hypothetical protein
VLDDRLARDGDFSGQRRGARLAVREEDVEQPAAGRILAQSSSCSAARLAGGVCDLRGVLAELIELLTPALGIALDGAGRLLVGRIERSKARLDHAQQPSALPQRSA